MAGSAISLGLSLGGGKSATSSGRASGGGAMVNQFSVDFDGVNDVMAIGSSYDLGCLSFWFKSDSVISASSAHETIIGFAGELPFPANSGIRFGSNAGAAVNEVVTLYTGGRVYVYSSSSATIDTNWHHLAFRWTGSDYEIYLDGVQVKNFDNYFGYDDPPPAKAKLAISNFNVGRRNDANAPFGGLIDEVAIWSTPLSASDTIALYNSGVPSDLTSLSPNGWWRMGDNDGGSGTTITDQGSGSNNGTLTNGPTFSSSVPS